MEQKKSGGTFTHFAKWAARMSGHPVTFILAGASVVAWTITGPLFNWSDTWQLIINTATNIITFLMVFIIQNSQNRDTQALQIKLDELIRSIGGAHNTLLNLEELDEKELDRIQKNYEKIAERAKSKREKGKKDTDGTEPKSD
jgi:low affinity Fe/Cu permease